MKIYLVVGKTGQYSDRVEWFVKAYRSEENAEALADCARERGLELAEWRDSDDGPWRHSDDPNRPVNEFDSQFKMDYNGTDYYVVEVELV